MTISSRADYQSASRQHILLAASETGVNDASPTLIHFNGTQPANTTSGLVPDDTMSGAPMIQDFSGSGYITRVDASGNYGGLLTLYDRLWYGGGYVPGSSYPQSAQPSYASRLPGGSYVGTRLFCFLTGSIVGSPPYTLTISYTNQDGTAGRSTSLTPSGGTVAVQHIPLQNGDTGVQMIEQVDVAGVRTSGGAIILVVMRVLWSGLILPTKRTGSSAVQWLDRTGMPQIFPTSCVCAYSSLFNNPSNVNGTINVDIEIASK